MTQYNTLNVKLSNSQFNKLKSAIENGIGVTLNHSSNIIGDSNVENKFHKLLLTNTQVQRLRKAFPNGSSANIKLLKIQLSEIGQSGGLLGRLLGPLLKTGLPLIEDELKPLAKSVLIPLGLTAEASATDPAIHKTMFRSVFPTLIISNEDMNDIKEIVKSLEESDLSIKCVKYVWNNSKWSKINKKDDFFQCY